MQGEETRFPHVELDEEQRAEVTLLLDALGRSGWRIRRVTTRTDEPMVMEPGAGAAYTTSTGTLDAEYFPMGLSLAITGFDCWEGHELLIHRYRRQADGQRGLLDVLTVLTDFQDRLTRHTYAEFGQALLKRSDSIEYYGDASGLLCDVTKDALDSGQVPIAQPR